MGKLIIVTREELEASRSRFDKLLADDPQWKEEQERINQFIVQEKKHRDTEYAAKRTGARESSEEAE